MNLREGNIVRIKQIVPGDTLTSRHIVGHVGHIEEEEILCNNEINYWIRCSTCKGTHYMHGCELELATGIPTKKRAVLALQADRSLKNLC